MTLKLPIIIILALMLFQINRAEAQNTEKVCSINNIPPGWYVINIIKDCKCCGFIVGDTVKTKQYVIENLDKEPLNTIIKICNKNSIPKGWVIIDELRNCLKCGDVSQTQYEIKKIWAPKNFETNTQVSN